LNRHGNAVEIRVIIDTLEVVAAKFYGDDALKMMADRAEAAS